MKSVHAVNFQPDIDLFAFRLNYQISKYASWRSDPGCLAVDALSISWSKYQFYASPPFSVVGAVLFKLMHRDHDHTNMDYTVLVSCDVGTHNRSSSPVIKQQNHHSVSIQDGSNSPTISQTKITG